MTKRGSQLELVRCGLAAAALLFGAPHQAAGARQADLVPIVAAAGAGELERLAATELADYLSRMYPQTRFPLGGELPASGRAILVGSVASQPELPSAAGGPQPDRASKAPLAGGCLSAKQETALVLRRYVGEAPPGEPESFVVTTARVGGRELGVIAGADGRGAIYGVYALLEKLGCGFYLSCEAVPPAEKEPFSFDRWRLRDTPLAGQRIVFNWHNFLSGCSAWNLPDWQKWIVQSQKMGYNTIMVHAYGNNPMFTFTFNGVSKQVGYLSSTLKGRDWGTEHVNDVRRLPGGFVFEDAVFGADAAKVPDNRRVQAKQALMKQVFGFAARRGMHVCFALDVDTAVSSPQEVILTLPATARFQVQVEPAKYMARSADRVWLANPDTPEGYAYYKAQAESLVTLYPQIDRLALWMRRGGSVWLELNVAQMPEKWQQQYRARIAETPQAAKLKQAPGRFAIARILSAFQRALRELDRENVRLMAGSWGFDWLEASDRFFPENIAFVPLDYGILRGQSLLADAVRRANIRKIAAHRPVVPIVWAHHDDGHYIGRSYTPFSDFQSKLADSGAAGFGVIHWTTRPLDLYFKSLSQQVWSSGRNTPLETVCERMAGHLFGPRSRELMSRYLYHWITTAPQFGRETRDWFIDARYTPEDLDRILTGCRKRTAILDRVDETLLDGPSLDRLNYFKRMEAFFMSFFRAEVGYQRSLQLLGRGDVDGARRALAECQPEAAIELYARASSSGGITRGEQGVALSLGVSWLPFFESQRQALRMAMVRYNYGPTRHSLLAQGAGSLTFHVDSQGHLWRSLGQRETGATPFILPEAAKVHCDEALPPAFKELCRSGIESDRPLSLNLRPIAFDLQPFGHTRALLAGTMQPGRYQLGLLMLDPSSDTQGQRVFDIRIGSPGADNPSRVDLFKQARGRNRVLQLTYPVEIARDGALEVTLKPVIGKALICGAVLQPAVDLEALERVRVISAADRYLSQKPVVITDSYCPRSKGGRHDYYSEGDYWWPNPDTEDGLPYVRRDGRTNPHLFYGHRKALVRLSVQVPALAVAYKLTGKREYACRAADYLRAFFLDEKTRMNPHLLYGQAIPGRLTGRGIGIIDTLHLVEVAGAIAVLGPSPAFSPEDLEGLKDWFRSYLTWITTHEYGIAERDHMNNHSSAWLLQVAAFARLVGDEEKMRYCRKRFKEVLLPELMDENGSFPRELRRTKPYGYSIFHLDLFAGIAQILSTPGDNLWTYESPNGRSMRKAAAFLYPYLVNKSSWPYRHDIMYWDDWPVRQPCLLFAGLAFDEPKYIELFKTLDPDPTVFEVLRNLPMRQPLLWVPCP